MKTISPALLSYLNAFRPTSDMSLAMANLFTITLASGSVLTYTDLDVPVLWNSYVYAANSIMISGLKYKCSIGLNVDQQDINISAYPNMTIGGIPFMQALQQGLFDGAFIQRERAFFTTFFAAAPLVPIGTVLLFKGRVAQIGEVGRTSAQATVASDTVLLDIDMPKILFQPNCSHVLYDTGCTLNRATYTTTGSVTSASTLSVVNWSGASAAYQQGALTFTSGQNTGAEATVNTAASGVLTLAYPLWYVPQIGDTFTISQGCDHTKATCDSKFGNLQNFRGFPFIPPPQIISGTLSSTVTSGK